MAYETSVSGYQGSTYVLPYDSLTPWQTSQSLAAKINAGITLGTIYTVPPDTDPKLAKGTIGEFVQTTDGSYKLKSGYNDVVDDTKNATIQGSGGQNESILVGSGNLDFTALKGSGTVAGGGGDDTIAIGSKDKGDWKIDLGGGNDSISLQGSGKYYVTTAGAATIVGGSGKATIFGSTGKLDFVGGSGDASVTGGSAGGNEFQAGSGNETLTGATGPNSGTDTFTFIAGEAGGTDLINNFISGDKIILQGYGTNEISNALSNAVYTPQGAIITLSDNTKITFAGVTHLDPKSFS